MLKSLTTPTISPSRPHIENALPTGSEIVENLGAALEQFSAIQEELETVAKE